MRAINHALTGAIIGLNVTPAAALPLALASHFVLDAIPHFDDEQRMPKESRAFLCVLIADATLCVSLVGLLFLSGTDGWLVASICAFLGASPDLLWIPEYLEARRGRDLIHTNPILRFHKRIQWQVAPRWLALEIIWMVANSAILARLI